MHRLAVQRGRLYVAYGDYAANTGPIHAVSMDLASLQWQDEAALTTEETWSFVDVAGTLYCPFIDPQGGIGNPENGIYASSSAVGSWSIRTNLTPYLQHAFAITATTEGLWLAGGSETDAVVMHSTDGGATWTTSLAVPVGAGDAKFYNVVAFGDELIAVLGQYPLAPRAFHYSAGWTEIAGLDVEMSDGVPFTYAGTNFYLCRDIAKQDGRANIGSPYHAWVKPADDVHQANIQATLPALQLRDAAVSADGLSLYLLEAGKLHRGDQAGTYTEVLHWDDSTYPIVSVAVDDSHGYLYFGTTDSRVLRLPIPA